MSSARTSTSTLRRSWAISCKVQNNVSVYHGVHIGDDVFVGPSATFTNDLVQQASENTKWKIVETLAGSADAQASIGANATVTPMSSSVAIRWSLVRPSHRDVADHRLGASHPAPATSDGCVGAARSMSRREANPPSSLSCGTCD